MVTSCDDAMAPPGGSAHSLLARLTEKATAAEDRVGLYSTLAQEFQKEDISDVLSVVSQHGSSLSSLFCKDIQCDHKELNQASLRILGLCLHYEEIAKSFSEADSISVLTALCNTILKTEDKNTCTRALWCLSRQQLPVKTIQAELHSILCAFENVLQQKKFQSMTAEYEAINLLIRLLDQIPDNMASHTTRWAPLLFPLIVHSAHKIRAKANQATQLALPALHKHQADLAPSLAMALKSTIVVDMAELFANKQEQFVLQVWKMFVELLGKTLHKGGSLINLLLRVVEQGFKHGFPEIKRASFEAWKVLIDNFSLDLDVLSNAKRLKLLLQPFIATSTKQESVALAKFDAWWHLCKALGPRLSSNFEMVVVPLLHFCLGLSSPASQSASATTPSSSHRKLMNSVGFRALAMTSPATTPRMNLSSPCRGADTYQSILQRGAIVMTYVLSNQDVNVNSDSIKQQVDDPPESLSMPVLSRGALVFIKITSNLIPIVFNSIQQHMSMIGEDLCTEMFGALTQHVSTALENSKKQDNCEMFGEFLYNLNQLVKHTEDIDPIMLLKFTASLKCLPTKVLSSTAYVSSHVGCVLNGTPTLFLLELLFGPKLIKSSTDERFFILLERLVECGISNPSSVLSFSTVYVSFANGAAASVTDKDVLWRIWSVLASPLLDHILQSSVLSLSTVYISVANSAATPMTDKDILWRIWSVLASPLLDHILQTNEVNQGDSFEHDFSAMIGCLLFPIQQILPFDVSVPTRKALLKTWTELYQAFARCAALVTTAGDNQSCQDLSLKIVAFVMNEDFQMTLPFIDATLQVCRVMLDSVDFSSYSHQNTDVMQSPVSAGKWNKKHHWPLKNLTAFVKLAAHLMNAFHEHRMQTDKPTQVLLDSWFSVVHNCCHVVTVLFGHIGGTSLLQQLIGRLATPISGFYGRDNRFTSSPIYKTNILPKLDKLWQDVLRGIQARYRGPYNAESLDVFEPLLEATLNSPHRSIRNHTLLFWNASFAKAQTLTYSSRMKTCLQMIKKTSSVTLPDWSDVEIDDETDLMAEDNTMQSLLIPSTLSPSPRKVHGSFLQRPTEARQLFASSSPFKSPGKSPKLIVKSAPSPAVEETPTRRKLNIEEESTQDFVFIAPSPKKRQILTDHQKEIMREKRVIPALYNDLEQSQDNHAFSELSQSQMPEQSMESTSPSDIAMETNILTNAFAALKRAEKKSAETETSGKDMGEKVKLPKDSKHVKFAEDEAEQEPPLATAGTNDFVAKMNEKIRALKNSIKGTGSESAETSASQKPVKGAIEQPLIECSVTVIEETQSQIANSERHEHDGKLQVDTTESSTGRKNTTNKNMEVIPETQGNQTSQAITSPVGLKVDSSPKTPTRDSQSCPFEVTDEIDLTDVTLVGQETTPRIKITTPRVKVVKMDLRKLELSQSKHRKQPGEDEEQTTPIISPSPTGSQTPNETPRFRRHKSDEVGSRSVGSGQRVRKWHSFSDAKTDSPKEKLSPKEIFSPLQFEEQDFPLFCSKSSSGNSDKMDIEGIHPLDSDADEEELDLSSSRPEEGKMGEEAGTPSLRRGRRQRKAKTFSDYVTPQKLLSSIHLTPPGEEATDAKGLEGCDRTGNKEPQIEERKEESTEVPFDAEKVWDTNVLVKGGDTKGDKKQAGIISHQSMSKDSEEEEIADPTGSATSSLQQRRESSGKGREKIRRIKPVQVLEENTAEWQPTQDLFSEEIDMGDEVGSGNLHELKVDIGDSDNTEKWTNVREKKDSQVLEVEKDPVEKESLEVERNGSTEPRSTSKRAKRLARGRREKRSEATEVINLCDTQSQEPAKSEMDSKAPSGNELLDDKAVTSKEEVDASQREPEKVKDVLKKNESSGRKMKKARIREGKKTVQENRKGRNESQESGGLSDDDIPLVESASSASLFVTQDPSRDKENLSEHGSEVDVFDGPEDLPLARLRTVTDLTSDFPLGGEIDPSSESRLISRTAGRAESPKTRSISPKIRKNLNEKFQRARRKSPLSTPLSARKKRSPLRSPRLLRSAGAIHTRLRSKGGSKDRTKVSPKMRALLRKRKKLLEEETSSTPVSKGSGEDEQMVDGARTEKDENIDYHPDQNEGGETTLKLDKNENIMEPFSAKQMSVSTPVEDDVLTQLGQGKVSPEDSDMVREGSFGNFDIGASADCPVGLLSQGLVDDVSLTIEEVVNSSHSPTKLNVNVNRTEQGSARHCGMLENLGLEGDSAKEVVTLSSGPRSPIIPVQSAPVVHASPVGVSKPTPCQGSPEVMGIPRVYSPAASPSNGILKKREEAGCNSPSPNNKNRRVKFSEKVSTKEIEHRTPNRSPGATRLRPGSKMSPSPLVTTSSRVVSVMSKYITTPKASSEKLTRTSSSSQHSGRKSRSPSNRNKAARFHHRLLTPPTQGSPSSQLESSLDDPDETIYPHLSDCQTTVEMILPQLTSSMWSRGLGQLMRARGICTVGQLSALTPSEVQSLPIRCPKVSHLRWVLGKHHQKLQAKNGTEEGGKSAAGFNHQATSPEKAVEANSSTETPPSSSTSLKRKRDTQDLPESPDAKKLRLVEQLEKLSEGCNDEVLRSVSPEQLFKAYGHINSMMDTIMGVLKTKYEQGEKPT